MIKSVHDYPLNQIFSMNANYYYVIPKYQREYAWTLGQWKDLYDDISENENGYFIGSIICIDITKGIFNSKELEVVDGQQRLMTLALLLTAIYHRLKEHASEDDTDVLFELMSLKKSLQCKDSKNGLILCPQIQNYNAEDFLFVMKDNGLSESGEWVKYCGNRRIMRCYKYFLERLQQDIEEDGDAISTLLRLKEKISQAILVMIEVENYAQAYTLFESLNNRGIPLTAVDLMKNLLLARAEKAGLSCNECFERWQKLLTYLTDDYATQERFFRQYYNAFKGRLNEPFRANSQKKDPLGNIATKSNLLSIYEALIQRDLPAFLVDILACGKLYADFILSSPEETKFTPALRDLGRIQGAPGYMLLLYLFKNRQELGLSEDTLIEVIRLLTRFFVRRNVTDLPATRDLASIFMAIIADIEENAPRGEQIYADIRRSLVKRSASDELFGERLRGDIYEENVGAVRFVLCTLAQRSMTKETWTDLWAQTESNGKKMYRWTIEHILPEGKDIPQSWVDMIAGGDRGKAAEYLEQYAHKLGNLTMTAYNSTLSNLSFIQKRDRVNKDKLYVGYKNGLGINADLAGKDSWTVRDIEERTQKLVRETLKIFRL